MRPLSPSYVCLLLAVLPALPAARAQSSTAPSPTAGRASSAAGAAASAGKYAAEPIVIERLETVYTYAADGTGTHERSAAITMQSEAALRSFGVIAVPYAASSEQVEFLYARVRHPDGTVVETRTADAIEMPEEVTRQAPFYSDLKQKQLPIRGLRVGDTLEWKARITRTRAEAAGQFWGQESFTDSAIVLSETLELRLPAGLAVTVWSPAVKPTESTEGPLHILRWTGAHTAPTAGKEADAAAEAKKKHVLTPDEELDADQGRLPMVAWSSFRTWEQVGSWFQALEADRTVPTPEIKARVAELTAGKLTDEDKARALYAWVATQVRYVGVAFGVGRYQPHTAAEVMTNQYGDCKDKHTLLAAMLRAAGFTPDAVLIGAGVRFNQAVPSPSAFNHLITRVSIGGQPVWLDTTSEIAPYRMLYAAIRDKQALVVPDAGTPRLDRTPAAPPFPSVQTMDADGSLDAQGTSRSRLTFTTRGDVELLLRAAFHQTSPGQYNQVLQQISYSIGYAGTTSNPEVSRPEDTAEPFRMSYDYERVKSGDWDNLKIIPQLAPNSLPRPDDADPEVRSLDLGYPHVEISHSAMKLPPDWTAELPEAIHAKSAWATLDQTYRFANGTVYAERRVEVLQQKVPISGLKAYKKWAGQASLGSEFFIQLSRIAKGPERIVPPEHSKASAPAAAPSATPTATPQPENPITGEPHTKSDPSNPAIPTDDASGQTGAQALLQQAFTAMKKGDTAAARKTLDQVKQIDAEQPGLWVAYAMLDSRGGPSLEAIADLKKELAAHPGETQVYLILVPLYQQLAMHTEEMEALRQWSATNPSDPAPANTLLHLLADAGDLEGARHAGEAVASHLSAEADGGDPAKATARKNFEIELAHVQLLTGEKAKGAATLEALLKDQDDPLLLNNAAYELADAGLDLPLAESSTRAALDKLAEESAAWTLDENPQTLLGKSNLTLAAWDTLGWVLFREGKVAEAQQFLSAAWRGSQSADTAAHLGDVLAALGKKTAAMEHYELALSKMTSYDGMGVRLPPGPKQKAVQQKVDALTKAEIKSTIGTAKDPFRAVQSLRTFPLGAAADRTGSAEYRVLLKAAKVVRAKPTAAGIDRADALLRKGDFTALFPVDTSAALVRSGYLNCHSGACEFIINP
ncbi:MAG: tetratricopeptide repeat protein [Acidobacteriota bacterium]|nr:tetratricopeptide repeat protein [Acidobacteriota bacterium]